MTKPTKWVCAKRRLRSAWASAQSDQSSICAQWVAKDPRFLHADREDSDQTGRMPRLIWVFTGRTAILLVLSCRGSFITWYLPACIQYYLHFYQAPNSSHTLRNMGNPLNLSSALFSYQRLVPATTCYVWYTIWNRPSFGSHHTISATEQCVV